MIRIAEPEDTQPLVDLLLDFYAENGLAPLNFKKGVAWVTQMVAEGRVILSMRDGEIAGAIGIREVPLNYSDKTLLCDEFFYVRMDVRDESVGRELREAFTNIASGTGQIGILTVLNPGRQAKRRRVSDLVGFIPFGYVLRLA